MRKLFISQIPLIPVNFIICWYYGVDAVITVAYLLIMPLWGMLLQLKGGRARAARIVPWVGAATTSGGFYHLHQVSKSFPGPPEIANHFAAISVMLLAVLVANACLALAGWNSVESEDKPHNSIF